MFFKSIRALFSNQNDRIIAIYKRNVKIINELEEEVRNLLDEDFPNIINEFRKKIQNNEETLNNILPKVFAMAREASTRTLGLRHYDVQLIGGMALYEGSIAEMKTGEGKTLVAPLAACLYAISGKGVHIVTVNDYLAKRDYEWMKPIYDFLGISVDYINGDTKSEERIEKYTKDVLYVTNSEIGFDYLRENMKMHLAEMSLLNRGFNFAIIDEVDSILIDESRTPLIISGAGQNDPRLYLEVNKIAKKLLSEHYEIDEKHKSVQLTEKGSEMIEKLFKQHGLIENESDLYGMHCYHLINHILQSLKAHYLFKIDKDYIVKNKEILLIDEFTGRIMEGRRYSEGLHQAIEAKENVKINAENQTLASITYQNFFRLYDKLSGMTGTAQTEAAEFFDIYGMNVVSIPPNRVVTRKDEDDLVYKDEKEKYDAIMIAIKEAYEKGQPILIGTINVDKSEILSKMLKKNNIKHNLLNAKHHEKESKIIADAGKFGAVTIATNMAGRGTDIQLGGCLEHKLQNITNHKEIERIRAEHLIEKQKVIEVGGLFVLGSERHESRRIDNQLRGRSGRQGDPGKSQFYLSLYDDLLRIFNGEKIDRVLSTIGFKGGEAMNHKFLNGIIKKSQKKIENFYYEMRKNVLKYDDIVNDQRKVIYNQRLDFMKTKNSRGILEQIIKDVNNYIIGEVINESTTEEFNNQILSHHLHNIYTLPEKVFSSLKNYNNEEISEIIFEIYDKKNEKYENKNIISEFEKIILLTSLDEVWLEHLAELDHIKEGIHLRSYAQKDPLSEYKIEAFKLLDASMLKFIKLVAYKIIRIEFVLNN